MSAQEFEQALRWAHVVLRGHESFAVQVTAGAPGSAERVLAGSSVRDPAMAENDLWILDQNPGKRMVLWANNLHVQRSDPDRIFRVGDNFELADIATMGHDLANSLGSSYLVIHAALHSGEAPDYGQLPDVADDSLDGVLNLTGPELFYLDIRPLADDRPGGVWIRSPQSMRAEIGTLTLLPATNFDAVYFVSVGTPAQKLG
ncbi:MAG: erythromycin esterase family protein [Actinomycetia bacterium]|nr:erythromycin esterase family protein [Actinomycetes bacterium]